MDTRSEKITTISTDLSEFDKYRPMPITPQDGSVLSEELGTIVTSLGRFIQSGLEGVRQKTFMSGGTGRGLTVEYDVFHRSNHSADEIADAIAAAKKLYPVAGLELDTNTFGWATNIEIVDRGSGYNLGDKLSSSPGITLSLQNMEETDIMPRGLQGARNGYWENKAHNPHKTPWVARNLRGIDNVEYGYRTSHKFERINGWEYLWTAHSPSDRSGNQGKNATGTSCLQVKTQNQMKGTNSLLLGEPNAHQTTTEQRWVCPRGFQYQWTNFRSHSNSKGLRIENIWFLMKFKDEKITRLAPIIENSQFMGKNYVEGDNMVGNYQGSDNKYGKIQAFMSDEDYFYCQENRAACIGMLFFFGNAKQSAVYNNFLDFYAFRLLFDTESHLNSLQIIPPPMTMDDYQEYGTRLA